MSKYHDDRTAATSPGQVRLSLAKLRALEPELFTTRTFKCGPRCPVNHPAGEMRDRFAEHLQLGDSRAAKVVSIEPLVVAAYSDDIDAVALLAFPPEIVARYGLRPGSRLLTVNTYDDVRDARTGEPWYAVDLVPGPRRSAWSNVSPFIADFLSDDTDRIEARKRAIEEDEWAGVDRLAEVRIARLGLATARGGRPTEAGWPRRTRGSAYFQPIGSAATRASATLRRTLLFVLLGLLAAVLGWAVLHG